MIGDFWEAMSVLKDEYSDKVAVIVTKMDHFEPSETNISLPHMKSKICEIFAEETAIDRILFSSLDTTREELGKELFAIARGQEKIQIKYSDAERAQYFGTYKSPSIEHQEGRKRKCDSWMYSQDEIDCKSTPNVGICRKSSNECQGHGRSFIPLNSPQELIWNELNGTAPRQQIILLNS